MEGRGSRRWIEPGVGGSSWMPGTEAGLDHEPHGLEKMTEIGPEGIIPRPCTGKVRGWAGQVSRRNLWLPGLSRVG